MNAPQVKPPFRDEPRDWRGRWMGIPANMRDSVGMRMAQKAGFIRMLAVRGPAK